MHWKKLHRDQIHDTAGDGNTESAEGNTSCGPIGHKKKADWFTNRPSSESKPSGVL